MKNKLFTTFDGHDIFEGDSWYYIKINPDGTCKSQFKRTTTTNYIGPPKIKSNVVRFKDHEKATEFMVNNTPKFSQKQVDEIISKVRSEAARF